MPPTTLNSEEPVKGWLSAVGARGGSLGGPITGGCARCPGCRYQNRARKGPADEGPAGPFRV